MSDTSNRQDAAKVAGDAEERLSLKASSGGLVCSLETSLRFGDWVEGESASMGKAAGLVREISILEDGVFYGLSFGEDLLISTFQRSELQLLRRDVNRVFWDEVERGSGRLDEVGKWHSWFSIPSSGEFQELYTGRSPKECFVEGAAMASYLQEETWVIEVYRDQVVKSWPRTEPGAIKVNPDFWFFKGSFEDLALAESSGFEFEP